MAMHVSPPRVSLSDIHPLSRAIAFSLRPRAAQSALSVGLLALFAAAGGLQAATFTVTNRNDAGIGSLRQAVLEANANPGTDEVVFDSSVTGTISLTSGAIRVEVSSAEGGVEQKLAIKGPGSDRLAVDGDVISVAGERLYSDPFSAEISGLTLEGVAVEWERSGLPLGYFLGPEVRVRDCQIGAAGVYVYAAELALENSTVSGAGGLAATGFWDSDAYSLYCSYITIENSVVDGGGIDADCAGVSISGSMISHAGGIGVDVYGSLSVVDSRISDNAGDGVRVWADIYRSSSLTIQDSTISGNVGSGVHVGGDYARSIYTQVIGSTVSGNAGNGVGFRTLGQAWQGGGSRVANSTISGNRGAGLAVLSPYGGNLLLENSTVSGNAVGLAVGEYAYDAAIVSNTVIAGSPFADMPESSDFRVEIAYSLIEYPGSVKISESVPGSNLWNIDPTLGPLQDNGGPTLTHALLPGSAAVDAGDPDFVPPPAFDQRGEGFERIVNGRIDMGAFEVQAAVVPAAMYDVDALGLVDANANPDIGVLSRRTAGEPTRVTIKDSVTRQAIGTLAFDPEGATPLGLAGVDGLHDGVAVAALFARPTGQGVVEIRDAASGAWLGEMLFVGNAWQVQAIASLDLDRNGRDEIGVLATSDDGSAAGVQIRDAIGGRQVNWVGFPVLDGSRYLALTDVADVNGNGTPELAALRQQSDGTLDVLVKDGVTKQAVSAVSFGQPGLPAVDLTAIDDIDGNGRAEVAVLLRKPNGQGIAQIRDAYAGTWIQQMPFVGTAWEVQAITSQDSNLDGVPELSVLAVSDDGARVGVQIRDAITGEQVNWLGFPAD